MCKLIEGDGGPTGPREQSREHDDKMKKIGWAEQILNFSRLIFRTNSVF